MNPQKHNTQTDKKYTSSKQVLVYKILPMWDICEYWGPELPKKEQ